MTHNTEALAALAEVRRYHPDVIGFTLNADLCWRFFTRSGRAPKFSPGVNVSVLERMADAVGDTVPLPATFYANEAR